MKVSVIIPVFNSETTIEKCILSIINQTFKDIEIIIINDGSTDNSLSIIQKNEKLDSRIKFINKENEGVSASRNIGIKISKGEYILFVDADDWLENDMVEKMVKTAEEQDVDVVRCNYYINYSNNKNDIANLYELSNKKFKRNEIITEKFLSHFLFVDNNISNLVMLLLIKKETIKNKLFFEKDLYMMEDVLFYQQLFFMIDSIYFLDIPLYHYFYNVNSVTKSFNKLEKNIYGIIDVNKRIKEFYERKNINDFAINRLNANHLKIITNYLFEISNQKEKNEINNILIKLYTIENFNSMRKYVNLKGIPKRNKLAIIFLKYKLLFLFKILTKIPRK